LGFIEGFGGVTIGIDEITDIFENEDFIHIAFDFAFLFDFFGKSLQNKRIYDVGFLDKW
jgi:hypothetical protein